MVRLQRWRAGTPGTNEDTVCLGLNRERLWTISCSSPGSRQPRWLHPCPVSRTEPLLPGGKWQGVSGPAWIRVLTVISVCSPRLGCCQDVHPPLAHAVPCRHIGLAPESGGIDFVLGAEGEWVWKDTARMRGFYLASRCQEPHWQRKQAH